MSAPIQLTVITARRPSRLSKRFRLGPNGELLREKGGALVAGIARRVEVADLTEFAAGLASLTPAQALTYGVSAHAVAHVVPKDDLAREDLHADLPLIARTREHFRWPEGPGILMLDHDPDPCGEPWTPQRLREQLYALWPGLEGAPHLWRASASSAIRRADTDEELVEVHGQRLYVVVEHAADIPRAGGVLIQRLWLAGLGRFDLSKSAALLERTLFDHAVWQPERLDFCGGADCQLPLVQQLPAPELFNLTAAPLDSRATLPDLSLADRARLGAIKEELRTAPALLEHLQAVRSTWIGERVQEALARHPEDDPGQVEQRYCAAIIERRLMGDFPIVLADGKQISVSELLDQPGIYHNQRCADPLDPGYRHDRRVAWINLRNAGRPYIYSHAHGGQRFILHRASQTLRVIKGELHTRVARILELMALDGSVFDRGGELVRVAESGQVYAVTPEWLTVHLSGYIRFEVFDARAGEWRPADCPLDLAKRVLAMQGAYGLPKLRAVITAPILTLDGRLLEQDGHDPASGLLLLQDQPDHALAVPGTLGPAELHEAMAALWHPFKDFPFVGPVDRGVMLAALLTAVLRPVLPTAPGFLFAAPTAGSGKTLIALCLSLLMGADPPALMPPTVEEEELRKRLLAALREGRPALVFDNVCGHLDSAALCAFLTAREYGDRVLGSSLTVFVPATGLFLATGNNVALVGDLNRRLLTCRIDPQTDKPYRRAFRLDPEQYVREHRQALVRAALALLRGYLATGRPLAADRTASYEDWSDRVRQTVLWVGAQGLLNVADPCDAIEASYEEDPETRKLSGLLEGWRALYGDFPKTLAEVIEDCARLQFSGPVTLDSDRGRLQSVLLEIAGEGGRINPRRLGRWIERMANRPCAGLKFERGRLHRGILRWRVVSGGGFEGSGGSLTSHASEMSGDKSMG